MKCKKRVLVSTISAILFLLLVFPTFVLSVEAAGQPSFLGYFDKNKKSVSSFTVEEGSTLTLYFKMKHKNSADKSEYWGQSINNSNGKQVQQQYKYITATELAKGSTYQKVTIDLKKNSIKTGNYKIQIWLWYKPSGSASMVSDEKIYSIPLTVTAKKSSSSGKKTSTGFASKKVTIFNKVYNKSERSLLYEFKPVSGATCYTYQFSKNSSFKNCSSFNMKVNSGVKYSSLSVKHLKLTRGKTYYFRICAKNSKGKTTGWTTFKYKIK